MQLKTAMGLGCLALGAGVAANSILGPLALKAIDYRTSETGLTYPLKRDAVRSG